MSIHKIAKTFADLTKHRVAYLEYGAFNELEHSTKYDKIYHKLFNQLIVDIIYKKLNIDPNKTDLIFNFFERDKNGWDVVFFVPDVTLSVDLLLQDPQKGVLPLKQAIENEFEPQS